MPKDVSTFALVKGAWVTGGACVVGLATALRTSLVEANAIKQAEHGRQSKMEVPYSCLAGPQFRQRVEAKCTVSTDGGNSGCTAGQMRTSCGLQTSRRGRLDPRTPVLPVTKRYNFDVSDRV